MSSFTFQSGTKRFFSKLGVLIRDTNIFYSASALSFNIFICSIPLSLLAVSILSLILSVEEATILITQLATGFFPKTFSDSTWLQTMLEPLIQRSGFLGLIGFGTMVVTAQGLFNIAKLTLFQIFAITERRHPFLELLQNFVTIGVLGALVLTFSLVFTLMSVFVSQSVHIPYLEIEVNVTFWYEILSQALSVGFNLLLFFLLFRYLSEKRICRRASFVGAITYTILFEISKWAFTGYVGFALSSYENLYQGYTLVVVTGFWAFYCAVIFVFSAMVSRSYQDTFLIPAWASADDSAH